MKKITNIEGAAEVSKHTAENWIARLPLRTVYLPAVRGRFREFTRENALEIAFIAALVKAGFSPSKAVPYADMLVRNAMHRSGQRKLIVFRSGDFVKGVKTDNITEETLAELNNPSVIMAIAVGEITRHVDSFFSAAEEA